MGGHGGSADLNAVAVLREELEPNGGSEANKDGHKDKVEGQLPCVVHHVQGPAGRQQTRFGIPTSAAIGVGCKISPQKGKHHHQIWEIHGQMAYPGI